MTGNESEFGAVAEAGGSVGPGNDSAREFGVL